MMSNNRVSDKLPLIFDLDGTLIDSRPEIVQTYRAVFQKVTPASPPNFDGKDFGAPIHTFLEKIYGNEPDMIKKARDLFVSIYDDSSFEHTPLYEFVSETLNTLNERGHKLYVATNKRMTPTLRILEKKSIVHFFSDVVATEMTPGATPDKEQLVAGLIRKHDISAGFMIGDTATDVKAGKKYKLTTVAVSYGYDAENAMKQNPDHFIHSLKELERILAFK